MSGRYQECIATSPRSRPAPLPRNSRTIRIISVMTPTNYRRTIAYLAIGLCLASPMRAIGAQTDEIQVYTGEIAAPGEFNLTVHSNYTPLGHTSADFAGGIVPEGSINGAFEWAYGVTNWFEAGLYLPVYTISRHGQFLLDGGKVRALFAVPNAGTRRFFYALNFEFSRNSRAWDTSRYGGEIRPIVGVRSGKWDFIANPILDTSFNGFTKLDFAPAVRVAHNQSSAWTEALEYYADAGELRHFSEGESTLFAVADRNGKFLDVEAGVGFGLIKASDRLVLKAILSHTF
jgi:hypothetical protein